MSKNPRLSYARCLHCHLFLLTGVRELGMTGKTHFRVCCGNCLLWFVHVRCQYPRTCAGNALSEEGKATGNRCWPSSRSLRRENAPRTQPIPAWAMELLVCTCITKPLVHDVAGGSSGGRALRTLASTRPHTSFFHIHNKTICLKETVLYSNWILGATVTGHALPPPPQLPNGRRYAAAQSRKAVSWPPFDVRSESDHTGRGQPASWKGRGVRWCVYSRHSRVAGTSSNHISRSRVRRRTRRCDDGRLSGFLVVCWLELKPGSPWQAARPQRH